MTIGLWKVIKEAPGKKNHRHYLCKCLCGKRRSVSASALKNGKSKGCVQCTRSKQPKGIDSPCWKGGRHIDENGYILVYVPDHPKSKSNGYAREHTVNLEAHLGRTLTKNESVHHKNGDRTDNRIENLELWSKSQPYGQRVEDKIQWAIEILKEYKPECLNLC